MKTLPQRTREKYLDARNASKEGKGTPRGAGYAGLIAAEWMRLVDECKENGLDWKNDD